MNLVLFAHPAFLGSQSQPRFARMLHDAYRERGHRVEIRQPRARLRRLVGEGRLAKWAGYVDQYIAFPRELRPRLAQDPEDTLYVFCDQALGPWVPLVAGRPHVVHCHDLLALRSALGQVPENPTSITGRAYQRYIRAGFRQARHFISISARTRDDLHRFGAVDALTSEVVYNGLNFDYRRLEPQAAAQVLQAAGLRVGAAGFLLHVGGGQWYKNTAGVLAIYARLVARLRSVGAAVPALWLLSPAPGQRLQGALRAVPEGGAVRFLPSVPDEVLQALYSAARVFLFPSLAEGFGWPIAEALACGCPVVTTADAPMTEVGGSCAHYLPRLMPQDDVMAWAERGATLVALLIGRRAEDAGTAARAASEWVARFDAAGAVDRYLQIYASVLTRYRQGEPRENDE